VTDEGVAPGMRNVILGVDIMIVRRGLGQAGQVEMQRALDFSPCWVYSSSSLEL
jgi:hypothetical protein